MDLNGSHFTSPPINAFAASTLTRLNLQAQGIKITNSFVETHTQGYSLVANGAVDAAGGVLRTFNSLAPRIKSRLRILWTSDGVAPHAFIIHPRINATVKQRILDALLSFKQTPEGQAFYKALYMNPFVEAQDADWDNVRQLMGM
jgi:phosphonate transport system substrate-binding protein